MTNAVSSQFPAQRRKVGLGLMIGIALLPIIFVWFLLRPRYSALSRLIGFGWMLIFMLMLARGGTTDIGHQEQQQEPSQSQQEHQQSSTSAEAQPTGEAISLNDAKALANSKYGDRGMAVCAANADDYLKSNINSDYKWDQPGGWLGAGYKFGSFQTTLPAPGVLVLISRYLLIQNEFGAYQRAEIDCTYDTQKDKVLGFVVQPAG